MPLVFIICLLGSCDSDPGNQERGSDLFLVQAKDGLNAYIDSANYYCDRLLIEYKAGGKKDVLTAAYGPQIKYYENSINEALDRANVLSKQKRLMPGVYERWLGGFNLKSLADKNKRLASIGVDLRYIPAADINFRRPNAASDTSKSALSQVYSDRENNFIIKLPADWIATEKEQEGMISVLAGPGNGQTIRDAAVGVNIMDYTKELTTEDFYYGNIALIKNNSKDFKMIQETDMDLNGIKSKCAIFSCVNNGISITSIQAYFFQNKKGYIVNGTSSSEHFSEYQDIYTAILKSFRVQDKK